MQKLVAEVLGILPPLSFAELRWKVEAKRAILHPQAISQHFTNSHLASFKLCLLPANTRLKWVEFPAFVKNIRWLNNQMFTCIAYCSETWIKCVVKISVYLYKELDIFICFLWPSLVVSLEEKGKEKWCHNYLYIYKSSPPLRLLLSCHTSYTLCHSN